jgi:ketosteroid isomerase-like protein
MPVTPPVRLAVARKFLLAVAEHDVEQAVALLSPDCEYRVPGHHVLAGTFTGATEVTEHLVHLFSDATSTFNLIKWEDWLEGDEFVAAVAEIRMQRQHRIFTEKILFLMSFDRETRIAAVRVFFDNPDQMERMLR